MWKWKIQRETVKTSWMIDIINVMCKGLKRKEKDQRNWIEDEEEET